MPRKERQPFNPLGEFVARRDFACNGKQFSTGGDFPWKRLSIDQRKLRRLWDHGFIVMKGDLDPEPEKEPVDPVDPPEPVKDPADNEQETEEEEDEEEDEEDEEESEEADSEEDSEGFVFDPDVHTLDHPAQGEWLILKGGDVVLRVERKEWKRLEKKTKPTKVNMDRVVTEE